MLDWKQQVMFADLTHRFKNRWFTFQQAQWGGVPKTVVSELHSIGVIARRDVNGRPEFYVRPIHGCELPS